MCPCLRLGRQLALTLPLILTSGSASPLFAQAGQPTFTESVDVALVNVEVWVSDSKGKAVTGLGPGDFQILHDGGPARLSHFAEIRDGSRIGWEARAPDPTSTPRLAAVAPPHLVVVVDAGNLASGSLERLARDLRKFIAAGEVPAERILLLRLDRALTIQAPFGSTAAELERSLRELDPRSSAGAGYVAEMKQVVQALQGVWDDLQSLTASRTLRSVANEARGARAGQGASAVGGGATGAGSVGSVGVTSGRACDDYVDRAAPIVVQWAQREREIAAGILNRLGDVTSFLSGLEGLKVVVFYSDALGAAPGSSATSFVRGLCPAFQTDLEVDTLPDAMSAELLAVTRRANANRVAFYPVQADAFQGSLLGAGSQASFDDRGIRSFEKGRRASVGQALALLAEETGGRAALGGSNASDALGQLGMEIGSYYSLAYTPPPGDAGRDHRIEVVLAREELTARHRRGYSDKSVDQWLTERLESALYLGLVDNQLGVRLAAAAAQQAEGDRYTLPLHVKVPVERLSFTEDKGLELARVAVKIMALNAADRTLTMSDRSMFLPRPGQGAGELMDLSVPVDLGSGQHVVAVALLDAASGSASFISTTIQVGPAKPEA